MRIGRWFSITVLATAGQTLLQGGEVRVAQQVQAFLERNCLACHGAAQMSGLDMRRREGILKGGKRGPAAIPGKAEESLLYLTASHQGELKMPPESKAPASAEELAALKKWIEEGLPMEGTVATAPKSELSWWSFRKPKRPAISSLKRYASLVQNPIDAFILKTIEEKGFKVAPPAEKRTLARRAYFDLLGLPPTPEQVEEFVNDEAPDAFEKLVERLLASPHYGERWGRHWLDVARYADSAGFETDLTYPYAYRYRDYVIKSFNDGKPYDRFVQEQIAGDELWPDDLELQGTFAIPYEKLEHMEARVGTGLYGTGPLVGESNMKASRRLYETLTDWVDTTGSAFLGLTFGCARCHDHKFDPISQRDYFRMQAIFAASRPVHLPVVSPMSIAHRFEPANYLRLTTLVESRNMYRAFEARVNERVVTALKAKFAPDVVAAFEIPEEKRTAQQQQLAGPLVQAVAEIKLEEHFTDEEKLERERLRDQNSDALMKIPLLDGSHRVNYDGLFDVPSATVLAHVPPELIPDVYVLERGDLGREQSKAEPGLPAALSNGNEFEQADPHGARHRKRLALWLTHPDHPLTARVMVNRIWQWHFGRGTVATSSDFGRQGAAPTHPELLDWLATEFVKQGWSVKFMHRLIMSSYTYQMSSRFSDEDTLRIDPENAYLWRMNRRRLEAEAVWDALHAVAGNLNLKMGGPPVMPPLTDPELGGLREKWQWAASGTPAEHTRRAVYIRARRAFTFPTLDKFDMPDSGVSCQRRDVTTVAPQALWLLNNQTAFRQAMQLADRLVRKHGAEPAAWVEGAWRLALGRPPSEEEKQQALALMDSLAAQGEWKQMPEEVPAALAKLAPARAAALAELCLAVFNLSEFLFVD